MKFWLPVVAGGFLLLEVWVGVLVLGDVHVYGWRGWLLGGFSVLLPVVGVGAAYLHGVVVGHRAGYVKGGDDMIQRVLV